jgi:hypothetical protein
MLIHEGNEFARRAIQGRLRNQGLLGWVSHPVCVSALGLIPRAGFEARIVAVIIRGIIKEGGVKATEVITENT